MAAAEFWKKYPQHMPVDRHRVRKWQASLDENFQINVLGSHKKGKKLVGPPLNKRVLVFKYRGREIHDFCEF